MEVLTLILLGGSILGLLSPFISFFRKFLQAREPKRSAKLEITKPSGVRIELEFNPADEESIRQVLKSLDGPHD